MSLSSSRDDAMPSWPPMPLGLPYCSSLSYSGDGLFRFRSRRCCREGYPSVPWLSTFPAQGSMNLGPILTPKSSELQILPRQRGEQIAPLPASTYGLFWAKSDLGVSGEELHMGWGRESTFSPPLFFFLFCFCFLMVSPRLDQIARKVMGVGWVAKPKICT